MWWFTRLFKGKEMKPMIDDETCIQRLVVNEGLKLKPYYCPAGYLTIGIGRNLDGNPLSEEEKAFIGHPVKEGITNDQAFYLCRNDLKKVRADLDRELPWWRDLNADRQFVMIDLCFNMGIRKLLQFQKTLNSIATGYYVKAGEQLMQSLYAKQVGKRAERNAKCLQTGVYK
ncbi:MAG: lysozyme [Alphaproteobacteria bacterium]|nr:lysozyme [Alphaproteobacteria bacterium]